MKLNPEADGFLLIFVLSLILGVEKFLIYFFSHFHIVFVVDIIIIISQQYEDDFGGITFGRKSGCLFQLRKAEFASKLFISLSFWLLLCSSSAGLALFNFFATSAKISDRTHHWNWKPNLIIPMSVTNAKLSFLFATHLFQSFDWPFSLFLIKFRSIRKRQRIFKGGVLYIYLLI